MFELVYLKYLKFKLNYVILFKLDKPSIKANAP